LQKDTFRDIIKYINLKFVCRKHIMAARHIFRNHNRIWRILQKDLPVLSALGGNMGRKEEPIIEYCEKAQNFADLLNGWMFKGERTLTPDQVIPQNSRYTKKSGKGRSSRYRSRYRDIVKRIEGVKIRVIVGTEVQTYVDHTMPVRIMDYDVLEYADQIRSLRQKYKSNDSGKIFLSGMKKEERLIPALTLVLYVGTEDWDGAKSLHEILDFTRVPEEFRKYIPNYSVYVLDICHESDERLLEFPKDIACMFLILKYQKNKDKLLEIFEKTEAFRCVDKEMYDAVWTYTGEKKLLELKEKAETKSGGVNMCQAIRELVKDVKMEGIQVLIETLQEFGVVDAEIPSRIVQKFHIPLSEAEEFMIKYKNRS